jgi:hypothetical protein
VYRTLHNTAVGQLVLVCAGAIPGYWFTVATIDWLGRRPIQIAGFTILTILFAVIGFRFDHLSQRDLLILYVLSQFFFNFGMSRVSLVCSESLLLMGTRSKCYYLYYSSRNLSNPPSVYCPWPVCCCREDRCHHCPMRLCSAGETRWHSGRPESLARRCDANFCALHVLRGTDILSRTGEQAQDIGGTCR